MTLKLHVWHENANILTFICDMLWKTTIVASLSILIHVESKMRGHMIIFLLGMAKLHFIIM